MADLQGVTRAKVQFRVFCETLFETVNIERAAFP